METTNSLEKYINSLNSEDIEDISMNNYVLDTFARLVKSYMKDSPKTDTMKKFEGIEHRFLSKSRKMKQKSLIDDELVCCYRKYEDAILCEVIKRKDTELPYRINMISEDDYEKGDEEHSYDKLFSNIDNLKKNAFNVIEKKYKAQLDYSEYIGRMQLLYELYNSEDTLRKKKSLYDIYNNIYPDLPRLLEFLSEHVNQTTKTIISDLKIPQIVLEDILNNCKDYFNIRMNCGEVYVSINAQGREMLKSSKEEIAKSELIYYNLDQVLNCISGESDDCDLQGLSSDKQRLIKSKVHKIKMNMRGRRYDVINFYYDMYNEQNNKSVEIKEMKNGSISNAAKGYTVYE